MVIESGNIEHFIDKAFHVFDKKGQSKKSISFLKEVQSFLFSGFISSSFKNVFFPKHQKDEIFYSD